MLSVKVEVTIAPGSPAGKSTVAGANEAVTPLGKPVILRSACSSSELVNCLCTETIYVASVPAVTGSGDCAPTTTAMIFGESVKVVSA